MLSVSIPKSATFPEFVDSATKCLATASSAPPRPARSQERAEVAFVIVSIVVNVFDATMNSVSAGIQVPYRLVQIGAVDVRHEPERQLPCRESPQGVVRHRRTQVRAADTDVDDVLDALAGVAGPLARAHPLREGGHPVEDRVHGRHDVLAVDLDHRVTRRPQRGVQHRTVLGDVDPLAAEHGVPQPEHVRRGGQLAQQPQRLVGDEVLGVVDVQITDLERVPGAAPGVGREQVPQMGVRQLLTVLGQGRPLGRLVEPATAVCVHLGLPPLSCLGPRCRSQPN